MTFLKHDYFKPQLRFFETRRAYDDGADQALRGLLSQATHGNFGSSCPFQIELPVRVWQML